MDRHDEKKNTRHTADTEREGDILGLGGTAVPKAPGDPTASNDPEEVAQRRERARADDHTLTPRQGDPYQPSKGATGIDMGAGGRGTDVSGE
jgi:hypothetical protein